MVSRVHRSWTGAFERSFHPWLAARLPAFVKPDHMTAMGVAGSLIAGLGYWAAWLSPDFLWVAVFGILVNWTGDSLDGNLARCRKIERPRYGFFVDHTTDVLSQLLLFFGLGFSPYMHFGTACLALIAWWLAALFTFIRAISSNVLQISYYGVGPTEIRFGLVIYTVFIRLTGRITWETRFGNISPLDGIVTLIFIAVFVSFLANFWTEAKHLAEEDVPSRSP